MERILKKIEPAEPGPHYCDYGCFMAKASMALVASDGTRAYILNHVGGHLGYWLGEGGDVQCFDGVEPGVWLWEGRIHSSRSYEGEYDEELVGDFRKLTEEEWDLLQSEDVIWDEKDWDTCPEATKDEP